MGGGIVAGKIVFVTGGWLVRSWLKRERCAVFKVVGVFQIDH
jgi:drug/metabolite transporter superfamily protein YnfA